MLTSYDHEDFAVGYNNFNILVAQAVDGCNYIKRFVHFFVAFPLASKFAKTMDKHLL